MTNSAQINAKIAYFSMEIGLDERMPTYCGGLGMLAGDTLRSAADLALPMIGVTLLYRRGYLVQRISDEGRQIEEEASWDPQSLLRDSGISVSVEIERRTVRLRAWICSVMGVHGHTVPVLLLDSDVDGNTPDDRRLTDRLYGGDQRHRLAQEIILGIGGVRALRALGCTELETFHMNEGHAALLAVELLRERAEAHGPGWPLKEGLEDVRRRCVFTTHTPIKAGHDEFSRELAEQLLGDMALYAFSAVGRDATELNMSRLALGSSRFANGVSLKHGEISRAMFHEPRIDAITNGIHTAWWASAAHRAIFDRHCPRWRSDAAALRTLAAVPAQEFAAAHLRARKELFDFVERLSGVKLSDRPTIGFARRSTPYKRPDLLLSDLKRLKEIGARCGGLQVLYAGKAHPHDEAGKELIHRVISAAADLAPEVHLVFLPNYDMTLGRLITAGVDVWLNTPIPPYEASGTSGMKAAINGVPSLSIRDGWWDEGCVEGVTGWAIGAGPDVTDRSGDASSLCDLLEHTVIPLIRERPAEYAAMMRQCIVLNGAHFNTHRMMQEYVARAYRI